MERRWSEWVRLRAGTLGLDEQVRRHRAWEWGWDDVAKRIVHEVVKRRQYGPEGSHALPARFDISLRVPGGGAATVQRFVDDPRFVQQIEADLLNRLDGAQPHGLPVLAISVCAAAEDGIEVREDVVALPMRLRLKANGHGWTTRDYALRGSQPTFTIGRGPWHGANDLVPNDVALPPEARFVSRRAGALRRIGSLLQVSARDQGRFMVVRWKGHVVRPHRAAKDAVAVGVGGSIAFVGSGGAERLELDVLGPGED